MPIRLFSLKDVFDDEADEVRELLRKHAIEFYETPPSKWGLSSGAIWIKDEELHDRAKSLLDDYQVERSIRVRQQYEQLRKEGKHERMIDRLRRHPLQVVFYLAFALLILYLSIMPFLRLSA